MEKIDYLSELLEAESCFVRRQFETLRQSYCGVFRVLPELVSEFDRLLEFKGVEIDLASIFDEAEKVLKVHSEWVLRYSYLSDEIKDQQVIVEWLEVTKKSAISMGFLSDYSHKIISESFDLAVKEAKKKILDIESKNKKKIESLLKNQENEKNRAHELRLKEKREDAEFLRLKELEVNYSDIAAKKDKEIDALKNKIEKYRSKIGETSVLAIVGTIFGMWGIGAFFSSDWRWYSTLFIIVISLFFMFAAFNSKIN
jgi:hypothetical protein